MCSRKTLLVSSEVQQYLNGDEDASSEVENDVLHRKRMIRFDIVAISLSQDLAVSVQPAICQDIMINGRRYPTESFYDQLR